MEKERKPTPQPFNCVYCGIGITEHLATARTANGRDLERFELAHSEWAKLVMAVI